MYDLIVPKENILRKINDLIDFSFIYEELLNKYCTTNGRMVESPVRMFKYLPLKTIYTISGVDVMERSRYNMSFKYFLDMNPEDDVINPSTLTKFRKLRLKDTDLLNPSIAQGNRKDADRFVCPAGCLAIKKARGGSKKYWNQSSRHLLF